ncbi:hypothetical protein SAMN05216167_104492 [Spirosoma endophyticum]|uniref:Uncharacterized protein n=1 Tax=Spirosoma endophyticum TaxID=662367 RepID=A0A1I1RVE7_9BACT|nr:hypothetical protein SAMN05216167_104492 [Spirosoma endophyticum]
MFQIQYIFSLMTYKRLLIKHILLRLQGIQPLLYW